MWRRNRVNVLLLLCLLLNSKLSLLSSVLSTITLMAEFLSVLVYLWICTDRLCRRRFSYEQHSLPFLNCQTERDRFIWNYAASNLIFTSQPLRSWSAFRRDSRTESGYSWSSFPLSTAVHFKRSKNRRTVALFLGQNSRETRLFNDVLRNY